MMLFTKWFPTFSRNQFFHNTTRDRHTDDSIGTVDFLFTETISSEILNFLNSKKLQT